MKRIVRTVAIGFVLGGSVFAEPVAPPTPAPDAPAPVEKTLVETPAPEDTPALTPQEMLDQTQAGMEKMKVGLKKIDALQEVARRQNDIIKLNCVNDKQVQVRAAINIAEATTADLNEAIARSDEGGRAHAFTKHTIAGQKVQILVSEAENCVGQDLSFIGDTQVKVDVDSAIMTGDPSATPLPTTRVDRPPEASPFI